MTQTDGDKEAGPRDNTSPNYECNICFDEAKEPVVTKCGHLYCWQCLEIWLDKGMNECPLCKSEVSRDNIIPLYGRGADNTDPRKSTRPKARAQRPTYNRSTYRNSNQGSFGNSISFWALPFTFGVTWRSQDYNFPGRSFFGSNFDTGFFSPFGNQPFNEDYEDPETNSRRTLSTFLLTLGIFILCSILMY